MTYDVILRTKGGAWIAALVGVNEILARKQYKAWESESAKGEIVTMSIHVE